LGAETYLSWRYPRQGALGGKLRRRYFKTAADADIWLDLITANSNITTSVQPTGGDVIITSSNATVSMSWQSGGGYARSASHNKQFTVRTISRCLCAGLTLNHSETEHVDVPRPTVLVRPGDLALIIHPYVADVTLGVAYSIPASSPTSLSSITKLLGGTNVERIRSGAYVAEAIILNYV
jgi:hypothetical protein